MATRYDDIIRLRGGKAAYVLADEKDGEWTSFIPNEQFNKVLATVLKSVRGNDIDYHKSFWINGTYGTGKSHAVAVLSHLLGDSVESIRSWVDYEYGDEKFDTLRNAIYKASREQTPADCESLWSECHDPPVRFGFGVTESLSLPRWHQRR